MTKPIEFTMNLEPVAWQRVKQGEFGQSYVPNKTRWFKSDIGYYARRYHKGDPLKGPLKLTLTFVLVRPKRPKFEFPATRPDLDNYVKAIKDGFNGILWLDDAQVVVLLASKIYDPAARLGRIEIQLEELKVTQ